MILRATVEANVELARQRREAAMSQNNARENRSRVAHNYKKGDWVLILSRHLDPKLQPHPGPFKVLSYDQSSGTLYIQRKHYVEPINIRSPLSLASLAPLSLFILFVSIFKTPGISLSFSANLLDCVIGHRRNAIRGYLNSAMSHSRRLM